MLALKSGVAAVILGLLLATEPLLAHHAFSARFDADKPIVLHGSITKMEWSNPHGWIYLDIKEADGSISQWSVEIGSPNALVRRGLRKGDFEIGTEIVITGFRAKDGWQTANGRTVTFSDGRVFSLSAESAPVSSDGSKH